MALYDTIPKVTFVEGLPVIENIKGGKPQLLTIDDIMLEADDPVVDIFIKWSHHKNLSVFFLTQNLVHQVKGQRDILLNAIYLIFS